MAEDTGKFRDIKLYQSDLNLRHRPEGVDSNQCLEEYGQLIGGEMCGDEHVNRFEPAMSDLLFSHEEMLRFCNALGVTKPDDGTLIRIATKDISSSGRNTLGVRLMNLSDGVVIKGMVTIKELNEGDL